MKKREKRKGGRRKEGRRIREGRNNIINHLTDIEFAWDGQSVWALQARPITTTSNNNENSNSNLNVSRQNDICCNHETVDVFPDVVTPLTWYFFSLFLLLSFIIVYLTYSFFFSSFFCVGLHLIILYIIAFLKDTNKKKSCFHKYLNIANATIYCYFIYYFFRTVQCMKNTGDVYTRYILHF